MTGAESTVAERSPVRARDVLALLRPKQWVKNFFVLAPVLFSGRFREPDALVLAFAAFLAFSFLASGVYAMNDILDRDSDRIHPLKKNRPVASGRIRPGAAVAIAAIMWALGLAVAWAIDPLVGAIGATYAVLNVAYSVRLKHVVIVDVFAIATFFVLRLLAGSAAVDVQPSIWLLVCGSLLALYLGFAKRRHELLVLGDASVDHRSVLSEYSPVFLDQMSTVLLSVTIVAYLMYTISPERVALSGYGLTYSAVFVLYGVFRYLYLVHQRGSGSPTEALLADRSLLAAVVLWVAYCGWVIAAG